jgi:preprotein translocase subunit SecE
MNRLKNIGKNIGGYFTDVYKELRKVIWPTRAQLVNNTISVLVVALFIGAVVWASDSVFVQLVKIFVHS